MTRDAVADLVRSVAGATGRPVRELAGDGSGRVAPGPIAQDGLAGTTVVLVGGLAAVPAPLALLRELRAAPGGPPAGVVLDVANATARSVLTDAVTGAAGRPDAADTHPTRRLSAAGVRAQLEAAGWVLVELHRLPDAPAGPVADPVAAAAVEAAVAVADEPGVGHWVALAAPAGEPGTLATLHGRVADLERELSVVRAAAGSAARTAADREAALTDRLAAAADLAADDRRRTADLLAAGSDELDRLRVAEQAGQAGLAARTAELARAAERARVLEAGRDRVVGAAVLRAAAPLLGVRARVRRAVRSVRRRVR